MRVKRRELLKAAAAGAAATAFAAPAIARTNPEIRWRMTSSFPKTLDIIFGASEIFARAVAEATDNNFSIEVLASGEVAPSLQALDVVQSGEVEMCHTAMSYYWGKDPTFTFGSAVPFGLNSRQSNAWMYQGGGIDLFNAFLAEYNVVALPGGNTGAQMGGWFRKEIGSLADLKGLRMRIGGFAGAVLQKLGVAPTAAPGADIYPAFEAGTLDAAEWVGPYDDAKLGFYKVAPFYYFPGWWQGGAMLHFAFNAEKFAALPEAYKTILRSAAALANTQMQAGYDARNPHALKQLVAAGARLRPFPQNVMEACYRAAEQTYAEISEKNEKFGKMRDAYISFRNDQYLWWQVAEYNYDNFMIRQRAK